MNSISKIKLNQTNIARFSFTVYIFFVIFGTSLPFHEAATSVDEIATSNPVNQFVFSLLYLLSLYSLIGKGRQIWQLVKMEKFLTLLLFWMLCTVFWSDYFMVSLKRWIQIFGSVIICAGILLNTESIDDALSYMRGIFMLYLPLTILAVMFVPAAIQWEFPAWRGLAPHKNLLGQMMLFAVLVWLFEIRTSKFKSKIIAIIFLGLSLIVFLGARSTTCFLVAAFIFMLMFLKNLGKLIGPAGVDKFFFGVIVLGSLTLIISIFLLAPDWIASLFNMFGKDMTFTGRIDLWERIFTISRQHFLQGCGFGGFWVMDSPNLNAIFQEFVWLPNTSHNGYLDLLNETGLVGLIILVLAVIIFFRKSAKSNRVDVGKWFVTAALLLNIQETTLFLQNVITSVAFLLGYLALFVDLGRNNFESV